MSMSQTRDEVIRCRLNKMTEWAKQRRDFLTDHQKEWKEDWYIRIGGNGFRAVSLEQERPLLQIGPGTVRKIETVYDHFKKYDPKELKELGRSTPEKCIQSMVIQQVHRIGNNMKSTLKINKAEYDELIFAFDEVSMGDMLHPPVVRCDMLAVGLRKGIVYPVVVELKTERNTKVFRQVKEFQTEILSFQSEFQALLNEALGKQHCFSYPSIGGIVVWPKSPDDKEQPHIEEFCHDNNIIIIQYNWDHQSNIENLKFKQVYSPILTV
jgi:hypothetical protein